MPTDVASRASLDVLPPSPDSIGNPGDRPDESVSYKYSILLLVLVLFASYYTYFLNCLSTQFQLIFLLFKVKEVSLLFNKDSRFQLGFSVESPVIIPLNLRNISVTFFLEKTNSLAEQTYTAKFKDIVVKPGEQSLFMVEMVDVVPASILVRFFQQVLYSADGEKTSLVLRGSIGMKTVFSYSFTQEETLTRDSLRGLFTSGEVANVLKDSLRLKYELAGKEPNRSPKISLFIDPKKMFPAGTLWTIETEQVKTRRALPCSVANSAVLLNILPGKSSNRSFQPLHQLNIGNIEFEKVLNASDEKLEPFFVEFFTKVLAPKDLLVQSEGEKTPLSVVQPEGFNFSTLGTTYRGTFSDSTIGGFLEIAEDFNIAAVAAQGDKRFPLFKVTVFKYSVNDERFRFDLAASVPESAENWPNLKAPFALVFSVENFNFLEASISLTELAFGGFMRKFSLEVPGFSLEITGDGKRLLGVEIPKFSISNCATDKGVFDDMIQKAVVYVPDFHEFPLIRDSAFGSFSWNGQVVYGNVDSLRAISSFLAKLSGPWIDDFQAWVISEKEGIIAKIGQYIRDMKISITIQSLASLLLLNPPDNVPIEPNEHTRVVSLFHKMLGHFLKFCVEVKCSERLGLILENLLPMLPLISSEDELKTVTSKSFILTKGSSIIEPLFKLKDEYVQIINQRFPRFDKRAVFDFVNPFVTCVFQRIVFANYTSFLFGAQADNFQELIFAICSPIRNAVWGIDINSLGIAETVLGRGGVELPQIPEVFRNMIRTIIEQSAVHLSLSKKMDIVVDIINVAGKCNKITIIAIAITNSGPAIVKLLQLLGDKIINPELREALMFLKSSIPPMEEFRLEKIIKGSVLVLKNENLVPNKIYSIPNGTEYFEAKSNEDHLIVYLPPIASASLGQGHVGLFNGVEVFVKVIKPEHQAHEKSCSTIFEALSGRENRTVRTLSMEVLRSYTDEFNLLKEYKGILLGKQLYSCDKPKIFIPGPLAVFDSSYEYYDWLDADRYVQTAPVKNSILVMERVPNCVTLGNFDFFREYIPPQNRLRVAYNLLLSTRELYSRFFKEALYGTGFFHGDPHSGNILVSLGPDPYIAVVDFGNFHECSSQLKNALIGSGAVTELFLNPSNELKIKVARQGYKVATPEDAARKLLCAFGYTEVGPTKELWKRRVYDISKYFPLVNELSAVCFGKIIAEFEKSKNYTRWRMFQNIDGWFLANISSDFCDTSLGDPSAVPEIAQIASILQSIVNEEKSFVYKKNDQQASAVMASLKSHFSSIQQILLNYLAVVKSNDQDALVLETLFLYSHRRVAGASTQSINEYFEDCFLAHASNQQIGILSRLIEAEKNYLLVAQEVSTKNKPSIFTNQHHLIAQDDSRWGSFVANVKKLHLYHTECDTLQKSFRDSDPSETVRSILAKEFSLESVAGLLISFKISFLAAESQMQHVIDVTCNTIIPNRFARDLVTAYGKNCESEAAVYGDLIRNDEVVPDQVPRALYCLKNSIAVRIGHRSIDDIVGYLMRIVPETNISEEREQQKPAETDFFRSQMLFLNVYKELVEKALLIKGIDISQIKELVEIATEIASNHMVMGMRALSSLVPR